MKSKEELARGYTINTFSFAYYNDDLNAKRIKNAYIAGFKEALKQVKELYNRDGLAAIEKYIEKQLKD